MASRPDTASAAPDPGSGGATPRAARGARGIVLVLTIVVAIGVVVVALILGGPGSAGPGADPGPGTGAGPSDPAPSDPPSSSPPPDPVDPVAPEPVPIASPGTVTEGVTATITRLQAVDGVARGPGEVSGPSIRFTVTIRNTTDEEVDLASTVVTVDHGRDRTPALQLFEPGGVALPTTVAAGDSVTGVYIFSIPVERRDLVHITVDYSVGVAPLEFTGRVP